MVELKFNKKNRKSIKFNSQEMKISQVVSASQKEAILEQLYLDYQELSSQNDNVFVLVTELSAKLDVLVAICVCEDGAIDFNSVSYEDLLLSGFLDLIRTHVLNFDDIRSSLYAMLNLMHMEKSFPNFNSGGLFDGIENTEENKQKIQDATDMIKKMTEDIGSESI